MIARTIENIGCVTLIAVIAVVTASFIVGIEADIRLELPLCSMLLFCLGFAAVFSDKVMPRITTRVLLHYTFLFYYTVWLSIEKSGVDMPRSIIITGLLPAVAVLLAAMIPKIQGRTVKFLSYVWFLIVLTTLIGCQFSIEDLNQIFEKSGFSAPLFAYSFFAGTVFLYFISNIIFIILIIPLPSRRNALWDSIFGSPDEIGKEFAEAMANKMTMGHLKGSSLIILSGHAILLITNILWEYISHGIVINASVAIIIWADMSINKKQKGSARPPLPMLRKKKTELANNKIESVQPDPKPAD